MSTSLTHAIERTLLVNTLKAASICAVLFFASTALAGDVGSHVTIPAVGDLNGDARYSPVDIDMMTRALLGGAPETMTELDFNGDGRFDSLDVLHLTIVVSSAPGYEVPAPPQTFVLGDVDGDGSVTINDVRFLTRHLEGRIPVSAISTVGADINKDGVINDVDLEILMNYFGFGRPAKRTSGRL